jgi:regulator of nonsense transcripts 2
MKTQQEAERAEQQRIKNLVLNYDLQENADQDGTDLNFLQPNPNLCKTVSKKANAYHKLQGSLGDKHHYNAPIQQLPHHPNARTSDKSGSTRGGQRARKLQLSDVDWYDKSHNSRPNDITPLLSRLSSNIIKRKG